MVHNGANGSELRRPAAARAYQASQLSQQLAWQCKTNLCIPEATRGNVGGRENHLPKLRKAHKICISRPNKADGTEALVFWANRITANW